MIKTNDALFHIRNHSYLLIPARAAFSDLSTTGGRLLRKRPPVSYSVTAVPAKNVAKKSAKAPKASVLTCCVIL